MKAKTKISVNNLYGFCLKVLNNHISHDPVCASGKIYTFIVFPVVLFFHTSLPIFTEAPSPFSIMDFMC